MNIVRAMDVWELLNNRNGLHLRKEEGRDNQLYEGLKKGLGCKTGIGLGMYLKNNPNITAVRFIQAMLTIAEPFAMMYRDIYRVMKEFNVKKNEESIKCAYNLDEIDRINFDLEHFKEFERIEIKIKREINQKIWTPEFLFEVPSFFRILTDNSLNLEEPNVGILQFPNLKEHSELTPYLMEIYSILKHIEEKGLSTTAEWSDPYPLAKIYYTAFINQNKVLKINEAISYYEKCFSKLETRKIEINIITEVLEEYLDLPFWKYRWYIYEVWVTMITLEELRKFNVRLNLVENNVLPLSSGRSSFVANFIDKYEQLYTVHAQLLTSVEGYKDRKGIQPDLRIIKGDKRNPEKTKIIIEYKQRLHMNKITLEDNVNLYEYGARNSWNLFVNYDRFPLEVIDEAKRTKLVSNVIPNQVSEFIKVFQDLLAEAGIYPKKKESFDAVLLDISYSMIEELSTGRKAILSSLLNKIEYGILFYFSNRLLETNNQSPDSFIENLYFDGSTDLESALLTMKNKYNNLNNILVITDGFYSNIPIEIINHFRLKEIHPAEVEDYLVSLEE